jgi:hypothetical protein
MTLGQAEADINGVSGRNSPLHTELRIEDGDRDRLPHSQFSILNLPFSIFVPLLGPPEGIAGIGRQAHGGTVNSFASVTLPAVPLSRFPLSLGYV